MLLPRAVARVAAALFFFVATAVASAVVVAALLSPAPPPLAPAALGLTSPLAPPGRSSGVGLALDDRNQGFQLLAQKEAAELRDGTEGLREGRDG